MLVNQEIQYLDIAVIQKTGMLFHYMQMGIVKKVYGQQVVHIQTVLVGGSGMEKQEPGLKLDFASSKWPFLINKTL
jgi:hypothetical protein